MLIFKKEKQARKLVLEHFAKAHECLIETHKVVEQFLAGDLDTARQTAAGVVLLESEADVLTREVREVLFSGAFLPNIRSDVCRLVERVDTIADKGESASRFIVNQSPRVPDAFHAELLEVSAKCVSCFAELRKALKCFFKPKGQIDDLHVHASRVGDIESEVDVLEARLTVEIFASGLEVGEKIHLAQMLRHVVKIADSAEDAADELEFAVLRSVV